MDMGVISTFKALYLRDTYEDALLATDPGNPRRITLPEYFKQFNVLNCVEKAARAWNAITEKNMKSMWKNCIPDDDTNALDDTDSHEDTGSRCDTHSRGDTNSTVDSHSSGDSHSRFVSDPIQDKVTTEIVELAKNLDMKDLDENQVKDLIGPMGSALSDQDLLDIEYDIENSEQNEGNGDSCDAPLDKVSEAMELVKKAVEILRENDPKKDRQLLVTYNLETALKPYEDLISKSTFNNETNPCEDTHSGGDTCSHDDSNSRIEATSQNGSISSQDDITFHDVSVSSDGLCTSDGDIIILLNDISPNK